MKNYYVYILTNHQNKTLYIGVTDDITRRTMEHKYKQNTGFAEKYNCYKLVYVEQTNDVEAAIRREKQLKGWTRVKKEVLINTINPEWKDLFVQ